MKIIIDIREPDTIKALFKQTILAENSDVIFEEKLLKVGDFKCEDIVVERKEVADFVVSLFDGRLFTQLYRMGFYYKKRLLVVIGDLRTLGYNIKPFLSALVSIVINYQTPILFCKTEEEASYIIYKFFEKNLEPPIQRLPIKKIAEPDKEKTIKINLLRCFPGIDVKLAIKVLDYFDWDLKKFFENSFLLPEIIGQQRGTKIKEEVELVWKK
jgi:DNA excision repair protein ERCC-4